jgi:hypothetical protein
MTTHTPSLQDVNVDWADIPIEAGLWRWGRLRPWQVDGVQTVRSALGIRWSEVTEALF